MKPLLLFIAVLFMISALGDQKYFMYKPQGNDLLGEQVTAKPNTVWVSDANGKLVTRALTVDDVPGLWGKTRTIKTFANLQAAIADSTVIRATLAADINISANITIPSRMSVEFNGYKFVESSIQTISFNGELVADRVQVFKDFEPGDITGSFRRDCVYPEWWGLEENRNEKAINAAAKSFVPGLHGVKVSLATGRYFTSAPIDLSGLSCFLEGSGPSRSQIWAASSWDANSFISGLRFTTPTLTPAIHTAMIWMGSDNVNLNSFRSGIANVDLYCGAAAVAFPDKYVSGISSKNDIEENSWIRNVGVNNFSGFGIGFENPSELSTVNGLIIEGFWITASIKRNSIPIYLGQHHGNCAIRNGTIDCTNAANDGRTFPMYGIYAQGSGNTIENVHMEGMLIGIRITQNSGPGNNIRISNIDGHGMINLLPTPMEYFEDGNYDPAPAPSTAAQLLADPTGGFLEKYSCLVLLTSDSPLAGNGKDWVHITGLSSLGPGCKYLLRDYFYGVEVSSYGNTQAPNEDSGALTSYTRANGFGPATGSYPSMVAGALYDKNSPASDKTYFQLIY